MKKMKTTASNNNENNSVNNELNRLARLIGEHPHLAKGMIKAAGIFLLAILGSFALVGIALVCAVAAIAVGAKREKKVKWEEAVKASKRAWSHQAPTPKPKKERKPRAAKKMPEAATTEEKKDL